MRNIFRARLAGILWLSLVGAASAEAPATHACASVKQDSERLACYDRAFAAAPGPAATGAAPGGTAPQSKPGPAVDTGDEFGMSARRKLRAADIDPDQVLPSSITAVITRLEWRRGLFLATLDNGQVWSQTELNSQLRVDEQESVTIRRGMLGSYLLTGKQGVATRVKRVK
jgi:hypothetical protein